MINPTFLSTFKVQIFRGVGGEEEVWPKGEEEISDHELMMRILNAYKGEPLSLNEVRELLPSKTVRVRLFWKKTIKPAREYVHERLRKLVEEGFILKVEENKYKPIAREEYFNRILSGMIKEKGYKVLKQLK